MNLPEHFFSEASEIGLKLEVVNGLAVWKASPVILHQKAVQSTLGSLEPADYGTSGCRCFVYADIEVRFPARQSKTP